MADLVSNVAWCGTKGGNTGLKYKYKHKYQKYNYTNIYDMVIYSWRINGPNNVLVTLNNKEVRVRGKF